MTLLLSKEAFQTWLVGSGQSLSSLESALKDSAIGHQLHVITGNAVIKDFQNDIRKKPKRLPHLVLYFATDNDIFLVKFVKSMKSCSECCHIPVIVLHDGNLKVSIKELYAFGASSVIKLPTSSREVKTVIESLESYWLSVASPIPSPAIPLGPT